MSRKRKPTPFELIDIAVTYIDDGALHTGVAKLREAADAIEIVAKDRDAQLARMIGKRAPKKGPTDGTSQA